MNKPLNILILSVGTRNKIVQYFKKELNGIGKIYAADNSVLAPALYEAHDFFITPRIEEKEYINSILKICKENRINAILSLIDPELNILAEHKDDFENIGVLPIVSSKSAIDLSFNKFKMNNFLKENGFNSIKSYIKLEEFYKDKNAKLIEFPVFVKPFNGSASSDISKVNNKKQLDSIFNEKNGLMIQEYINGREFGADVYIDLISGEPISIFVKEKLKMRAGETDKSVSYKDNYLFDLIMEFVRKIDFRGIIDIDIFKVKDKYYISEVNPRFGGGYPHAYESGINVPQMIIKNLNGIANHQNIGQYETDIFMMKYSDLMIKNKNGK